MNRKLKNDLTLMKKLNLKPKISFSEYELYYENITEDDLREYYDEVIKMIPDDYEYKEQRINKLKRKYNEALSNLEKARTMRDHLFSVISKIGY